MAPEENQAPGKKTPKGPGSHWCANEYKCEVATSDPIHPYLFFMLEVRKMSEAGYPFSQNDLSLQEWMDLWEVQRFFSQKKDASRQDEYQALRSEMLKLVQSRPQTKS